MDVAFNSIEWIPAKIIAEAAEKLREASFNSIEWIHSKRVVGANTIFILTFNSIEWIQLI